MKMKKMKRVKNRCLVNQINELFIRALVEESKLSQGVYHSGRPCVCFRVQQHWIIEDICFCIVMLQIRVNVLSYTLTKQAPVGTVTSQTCACTLMMAFPPLSNILLDSFILGLIVVFLFSCLALFSTFLLLSLQTLISEL